MLAGGFAVQVYGLLSRPSEDIDLFTVVSAVGDFSSAVRRVAEAYHEAGLGVELKREGPTFAQLEVRDHLGQVSKVEMAVDWRAHPPVRMDIGPVLHRDDAVANKVTALYGRYETRDFIDVDAALQSGQYTRADLLRLAAEHDPGFEPALFAEALDVLRAMPDADFVAYGLSSTDIAALRERFANWRAELTTS